jgi:hypothetical protein
VLHLVFKLTPLMSLRLRSLLSFGAAAVLSACLSAAPEHPRWPEPWAEVGRQVPALQDDAYGDGARIERQPICLGARAWSAGVPGATILYRAHRAQGSLHVGYFAYWSTERPWGHNLLTYLVLPALFTDAFYSHFMYIFPGAKDVLSGAADVEGASVDYEQRSDGSLNPLGGWADDGSHGRVHLTREDLVDRTGRVVLLSDVWSHQLGTHGAGRFSDDPRNHLRCYGSTTIQPLTDEVARVFRLGDAQHPRRALPAWN